MLSHKESFTQLSNTAAVTAHFNELKGELDSFATHFTKWVQEKKRFLGEDKQAFEKTLQDEQEAVDALRKQYAQLQAKKEHLKQGKHIYQPNFTKLFLCSL